MGRLLDNLPERDSSSGGSQCTTPCTQSVSASQRQVVSTDSNADRLTDVASLLNSRETTTASVQSISAAGELQTSVHNTGTSHLIKVSNGCHQFACISAQDELHSTSRGQFHRVCMSSQEPRWSPSATVSQSAHSRLDVSITRDIAPACRPVTVPTCCSRGGVYPASTASITGRLEPLCVTTPSSTGRGGLSAYDSSSHHVHLASTECLNGLIANSSAQSHTRSRPVISVDRHQATVTSSATNDSDWVTTHS